MNFNKLISSIPYNCKGIVHETKRSILNINVEYIIGFDTPLLNLTRINKSTGEIIDEIKSTYDEEDGCMTIETKSNNSESLKILHGRHVIMHKTKRGNKYTYKHKLFKDDMITETNETVIFNDDGSEKYFYNYEKHGLFESSESSDGKHIETRCDEEGNILVFNKINGTDVIDKKYTRLENGNFELKIKHDDSRNITRVYSYNGKMISNIDTHFGNAIYSYNDKGYVSSRILIKGLSIISETEYDDFGNISQVTANGKLVKISEIISENVKYILMDSTDIMNGNSISQKFIYEPIFEWTIYEPRTDIIYAKLACDSYYNPINKNNSSIVEYDKHGNVVTDIRYDENGKCVYHSHNDKLIFDANIDKTNGRVMCLFTDRYKTQFIY